jgi:ABC-type phosphate transport system substrate-binding protein
MRTMIRKVAAVATVAALPLLAAGLHFTADSSLTFNYTQSQDTQSPQTATGGTGTIDFTGSVTTPTPCYELTAEHTVRGPNVTLTVTATQVPGFCAQVITYNNYEGQISGLDSGTYRFRVIHDVNGSRTTAYDDEVTVG